MSIANKSNSYDQMAVDINSLFSKRISPFGKEFPGYFRRLFNRYLSAVLIVTGLYDRLVDAGFIRNWFEEFRDYWLTELKGRPLYLHDFYYLLGVYRQRYQMVETIEGAEKKGFLESWQNSNTLYQLFGAVRRYAYQPLHCYKFEKWIKHGDSVLEYGCGVAPVAHSLLYYGTKRNLDITIADIRQINSHYAKWRLGKRVKFLEIEPFENPFTRERFDAAFMVTVMEHLPDPLATVENITASLRSGGIFIFDYILGDGDGLDTVEAVQQRGQILEYIAKNYDLLTGELTEKKSMGTTVCKRK